MTVKESVIPADKIDILESTALAHIATIGPNGEPQSNPVWFTTQYASRIAGVD